MTDEEKSGWAGSRTLGTWWFRISGYGLVLKASWNRPLFSERNGHKKYYYFVGWRIGFLKP